MISLCDDSAQQRNTAANKKRAIPNQVCLLGQLFTNPRFNLPLLTPPITNLLINLVSIPDIT